MTSVRASSLTVLVCTRDRPEQLREGLAALEPQLGDGVDVLVVDQSEAIDEDLSRRATTQEWLSYLHDRGTGLSRARNLGYRNARGEWVAYLDDDCVACADWAAGLRGAIAAHPEVEVVAGYVGDRSQRGADYVRVSVFEVERERVLEGRWTLPWRVGLGCMLAIRRETLVRMGGFDERLGPGIADFPGADDMDFNYRFLHAGGKGLVTPAARVWHEQWRSGEMLPRHHRGYLAGWAGFASKHLRRGDVLGGLWLWSLGAVDVARMFASALRRRSRFRLRVAVWKLRGLASGTAKGLSRSW